MGRPVCIAGPERGWSSLCANATAICGTVTEVNSHGGGGKALSGVALGDISRFGILKSSTAGASRGTCRLHQMPQLLASCLSMGRHAVWFAKANQLLDCHEQC